MERKLRLESEAIDDLAESYQYYESQKEGLGEEFAVEVKDKIDQIVKKPFAYSIFYKDTRKTSLKRFPFNILYIVGDLVISVIGIWHKSRDPKNIKTRSDSHASAERNQEG